MRTLLVVDMQKGFITDSNRHLVEKINNLIKSKKFDKIVATQFVNKKDSQFIKSLNWNEMFSSPQTDFAVDLPKDAIIIKKHSYGLPSRIFKDDGIFLSKDFVLSKTEEIYICGTDYDACVLAIGYQLFDEGYAPKFFKEAIGSSSRNPIDKNVVEKIMQRNFGKEAVVFQEELEKE